MKHSNNVVRGSEVIGVPVRNLAKEYLGHIEDVMLDKHTGKIVYVVMEGKSLLGIGGKLFAVPWHCLHFDALQNCFVLDVAKEKLKATPGFDRAFWPDLADKNWGPAVVSFYPRLYEV